VSEEDDKGAAILDGNRMEDLFPGYYPPNAYERKRAYQHGLISLDANALLDLYRFSRKARQEFFRVLESIRTRLFITHQAALEFHRNRLSTVEGRLKAAEKQCEEIERPLKVVTEKIQEFANRYQIDTAEQERLVKLVQQLSSTLTHSIQTAGTYDLTVNQVKRATDDVLKRLDLLLINRIGKAPSDTEKQAAITEARRRQEWSIPPGYGDEKKSTLELQAGDYLVWRQLIDEASKHSRPVLFVTNENKGDWVLEGSSNQILGPRPELVLEMERQAKVRLHMVSVVGFLKEAPEYLGTDVSDATIREAIREAESFPASLRGNMTTLFSPSAQKEYADLTKENQAEILEILHAMRNGVKAGERIEEIPNVERWDGDHYSTRWSIDGRIVWRITDDPTGSFNLLLRVDQIIARSTS
jgi:hypothetical protein